MSRKAKSKISKDLSEQLAGYLLEDISGRRNIFKGNIDALQLKSSFVLASALVALSIELNLNHDCFTYLLLIGFSLCVFGAIYLIWPKTQDYDRPSHLQNELLKIEDSLRLEELTKHVYDHTAEIANQANRLGEKLRMLLYGFTALFLILVIQIMESGFRV